MSVDLDALRLDIREYITTQLKDGEVLLTNAPVGIETFARRGTIVARPRRRAIGAITAEQIAGSFLHAKDYEGVRMVKYPSHILRGMAAVIAKPR